MPPPLASLLTEILDLRDKLGSPIRHLMRQPVPHQQVVRLFQGAGVKASGSLLDLYAITDGFEADVRFVDGMRLLPVEAAVRSYLRWKPILLDVGAPPLFPITENEFGDGYGVLLSATVSDPPVISMPMQCGTDQFFDSLLLMFETLAAWLRVGMRSAYDADADVGSEREGYLCIGRHLNPKSCYATTV